MLLIIPTFNAGELWPRVIDSILKQSILNLRVCVIDSGSQDATVMLAKRAGWDVEVICAQDFDHGGTRQKALSFAFPQDEFVFYMTQDAILSDEKTLSRLLKPFSDPKVALVYGRQLPHENATLLSAQARAFNYPEISSAKTYADRAHLGIKTPFCSNSFAAYRLSVLDEVGGFAKKTIMGEDMLMAVALLKRGYTVFYESTAHAYHSHNYSMTEEFKRYFDTGVFHHDSQEMLRDFGGVGQEGLKLLKAQLSLAANLSLLQRPLLVVEVVYRNALKFLAYHLGKHHQWLPLKIKIKLSLFKSYWY